MALYFVINPILHWGGGAIMAWMTKDLLPFPYGLRYAPQISWLCFFQCFTSPRRVVFRKKKFLQKISHVVKNIHRGDPSMQKSKFSKKIFFWKILFFLPEYRFRGGVRAVQRCKLHRHFSDFCNSHLDKTTTLTNINFQFWTFSLSLFMRTLVA